MQVSAPATTSAAIIAALGFTPASAGAVLMQSGTVSAPGMPFALDLNTGFYQAVDGDDILKVAAGGVLAGSFAASGYLMPDGTAAAPSIALASDATTGLFRRAASVLGVAAEGLQHTSWQYQNVLGTNDGALTRKGRSQTFSTGVGGYAYPVTDYIEVMTITANTPIVMNDISLAECHVGDTTTQTAYSYTTELDKTDIIADAGAVSFSKGWGGCILRIPIAKTNVTLANAVGLDFTIPNSASVTGTHTNTKLIRFPTSTGGATSNYYGLFFEATYNGGHIVADTNIPLTINSLGASGYVSIGANAVEMLRVGISTGNYISAFANSTPTLAAAGSGSNIVLQLSGKGTSGVDLMSGNSGRFTLRAFDAGATSTNYMTTTSSVAGNPILISSAGGDTDIDMSFVPKGSGVLKFGSFTATGGETYAGYITIKDSGGTSRKLAVFA